MFLLSLNTLRENKNKSTSVGHRGVERLHQDNVVPHYVSVVTRGGVASPLDFNAPAETLGVVRVLWLERLCSALLGGWWKKQRPAPRTC